jgi:hypothetical protein
MRSRQHANALPKVPQAGHGGITATTETWLRLSVCSVNALTSLLLSLGLLTRRVILRHPNLPRGTQRTRHDVLIGRRQANMGSAVPAPSAMNGKEQLGRLFDERGLLLRRKHQIAVALALRGKRGKDPAAHSKVGRAHMRTLFGALQTQRDPSKIVRIHKLYSFTGEPIHQVMPHESTTPALR